MTANPYEQPDFAATYVAAETDSERNRYEWQVTLAALSQFIQPGMRVIDYGCGSGVFTAAMAEFVGPDGSCIGTDASAEMLSYSEAYADQSQIRFEQWDACLTDSPLQDGTVDLVVAKLCLNYIAPDDLYRRVLPRLRACLKDTGLLVAVLPNPFKEAGYDPAAYSAMDQVTIQVGGFGDQLATAVHHHLIETFLQASYAAGFAFANVLTLPGVKFDPNRQTFTVEAHNLHLDDDIPYQLIDGKRLLYVLGAGMPSYNAFSVAFERHCEWLREAFPTWS